MSIAFKRDILNALTSAVTYRVVALDLTELQLNYKTEYELHQLVNEQLALVQEAGPYCDAVQVLVGESDTVDPRGVTIRITTVIESCPTSAAGTVRASVTAERMDTGDTIVSAATLVYVTT